MGVFAGIQDLERRIVLNYDRLADLAAAMHQMGLVTVVTIGTYDLTHVGHYRYLERARAEGDILIVGLDSDAAVKRYKGPTRPMWPENERMETLLHSRYVDFVTIIDDVDKDGAWQYGLIRAVRPKVFVAVEDSYPEGQLAEIRQYCDDVRVFPRQAETSTSESIRKAVVEQAAPAIRIMRAVLDLLERGENIHSIEARVRGE